MVRMMPEENMSKGGTVGGILVQQQQNGIMNGPGDWANQTLAEKRSKAKRNQPTMATTAKSVSPSANRQNHQRRRNESAKQLYRRYVNKSNLFAESPASKSQVNLGGARWQIGGVPNGTPFRMSDSMPSPNQLEWQKQRRAHTRQLAMNAPGSLNGPKIVQKHAEMRSYLLHCQRVLNARPRVDTGRPTGRSAASSSSITSPSVASSLRGEFVGPKLRQDRARSVPANAANRRRHQLTGIERELQEENRRLLERLVQMRISDDFGGNGFDSFANSQHQSRQSTGQNNYRQARIQAMASRRKRIEDDEEEGDEIGNDDI